jgi:hypothetical protein
MQSESVEFSDSCLRALDSIFHFTDNNNSEIKLRWQLLCLHSEADW